MMKSTLKTKKINSFISALFIAVLSLIFLIIFMPMLFGFKGYYIKTDSMSPKISRGSLVLVKEVEFTEVKAGDILTFTNEDGTKQFTHRAVNVDYNSGMITTKGDANKENDPSPTSCNYLKGKVNFSIPFVGYAAIALDTTAGKVIAASVFIAWVAVEIEIFFAGRKKLGEKT